MRGLFYILIFYAVSGQAQIPFTQQKGCCYPKPDNIDSLLTSCWEFNGDSLDRHGVHDVTFSGGNYTDSAIIGSSYHYDGVDARAFVNGSDSGEDSIDFERDTFSISLWAMKLGQATGNQGGLVTRYSSVSSPSYKHFLVSWFDQDDATRDDSIMFKVWGSGSDAYVYSNGDVSNDVWHHVVAVCSYDSIYLYIDTVLQNVDEGVGIIYADGSFNKPPVYIGAVHFSNTSPDLFFNGLIDEVRYYNRALGVEEIKWLYYCGQGRGYDDK